MASQRIDFVPFAPVRLLKPTGAIVSRGVSANTDAARGAAFQALLTEAVAGDTIEVAHNCQITVAPRKNGVRIVPLRGAVLTNIANLPDVTPDDFPATVTTQINRRRDVQFFAPEPEFCFYHHDFSTSVDAGETVFATTNGTRTQGQGMLRFTTPSTGSGTMLGNRRFQGSAQLTAYLTVLAMNSAGTYNHVGVGFAITSTATSDTVTDRIIGRYGRNAASPNGYVQLEYTYSGGTKVFVKTDLTTPLAAPFKLIVILNHGSMALAVDEGGRQRILISSPTAEINPSVLDMESAAVVAKLRPMIDWETDGALDCSVTDWNVAGGANLGMREHYPATYEDGEPIRNAEGLHYVTADATGPTTVNMSGPAQYSEYMKNQSTTLLYSADTGRFIKNTAKYCVLKNGKIFGAQQGKVMYDRRTGLYHWYSAEWNDTSDRVQMIHYATYSNILHGYWVFDSTQFDVIDLTGHGAPFTATGDGNGQYDTDIIYYQGYWYLAGTVSGIAGIGRAAFCIKGNSPNDFTPGAGGVLQFVDNATEEGTRIWRVGGTPYVATSLSNNSIRILSTFGIPFAQAVGGLVPAGYPTQASLIPVVKAGKTQYQVIAFTDSARPAPPNTNQGGDDYKVDFNGQVQSLTFGATQVWDLVGWQTGEEFTDQPRGYNQ